MKRLLTRSFCLFLALLFLVSFSACSYPGRDLTVYREDGAAVRLSDFRGRPMAVLFWASWSREATEALADFEEMYLFYGDRVAFLAVNLADGTAETKDSALRLIRQKGYTFPVYFDTEGDARFTFEFQRIPAYLFSDRAGNPIYFIKDPMDAGHLQTAILDILSL